MRKRRPARAWFVRGSDLRVDSLPLIDFQMHSRWTDGNSTVAEMIAGAEGQGLEAIAITEHVNASSAWYAKFAAEVRANRRATAVEVYFGAEIAAADYHGRLKADPRTLETELLLGVVHRYPKEGDSGFWEFPDLIADDAIELELRALLGLTSNRSVDVLAHPGGTTFKKFGAFPVAWLEPIVRAAAENDVAVELNSKYAWDLDGMLQLLRRVDPLVSFGSDAHDASAVGVNFHGFEAELREGAQAAAL